MTTLSIRTQAELEKWIKQLDLDAEQAAEIRANFKRAKQRRKK